MVSQWSFMFSCHHHEKGKPMPTFCTKWWLSLTWALKSPFLFLFLNHYSHLHLHPIPTAAYPEPDPFSYPILFYSILFYSLFLHSSPSFFLFYFVFLSPFSITTNQPTTSYLPFHPILLPPPPLSLTHTHIISTPLYLYTSTLSYSLFSILYPLSFIFHPPSPIPISLTLFLSKVGIRNPSQDFLSFLLLYKI